MLWEFTERRSVWGVGSEARKGVDSEQAPLHRCCLRWFLLKSAGSPDRWGRTVQVENKTHIWGCDTPSFIVRPVFGLSLML